MLRCRVALVAKNEANIEEWQTTDKPLSPEALLKSELSDTPADDAKDKVLKYLRDVRAAGGWPSFVSEQRHSLGVLRALWRRIQNASRQGVKPALLPPPHDQAVLCKLFDLPDDLFAAVLHFYTNLLF